MNQSIAISNSGNYDLHIIIYNVHVYVIQLGYSDRKKHRHDALATRRNNAELNNTKIIPLVVTNSHARPPGQARLNDV